MRKQKVRKRFASPFAHTYGYSEAETNLESTSNVPNVMEHEQLKRAKFIARNPCDLQ
jgi:hypothetical protein